MEDVRLERIREIIEPLRVEAGTKVVLERDFDPGNTGDMFGKKDSKRLLTTGVEMLDYYQSRLAALEQVQRIGVVAGRDRNVVAEAEGVVLVDPGVIARFRAAGFGLADALELRTGQSTQRPAFGTMLTGRGRPVEHLALLPVEARQMPARQ